jgi:phosphate:Na+ symporter
VSATDLASLIGGIGLFLLGMRLLTDGLKLAAGDALRGILARWTGTPLRGMAAGALVTAVVQSSSAVTVATIGFVNAGLMSLAQSVAVVFGSNVGTTVTGWLVTLVGFDVNVTAAALPAVGVGMGLRVFGGDRRGGALGETLAGFGVFFLGLAILKDGFTSVGAGIAIPDDAGRSLLGVLPYVGVGFLLTLVMQSSSAALAVAITGAAGGVVPLAAAAGMVLGANVGTTSTATLAAIGATANARRVAAAHVVFNGVTGAVALAILSPLLAGLAAARTRLGMDGDPAALLAAFHTLFNVLGVILLWPALGPLVRWLETRFRTPEEDAARPRYLDRNVVATPALGLNALVMELARAGGLARDFAIAALTRPDATPAWAASRRAVLQSLLTAIAGYVALLRRGSLPPALAELLPSGLRVVRYDDEMAEVAEHVVRARRAAPRPGAGELDDVRAAFDRGVAELVAASDAAAEGFSVEGCRAQLASLQKEYQALKSRLLEAGARGDLTPDFLVEQLDRTSDVRRIAEQAEKAATHLAPLVVAARVADGSD